MRNKIVKLIAVAVFLLLGNSARASGYDIYVNAGSGEAIEDGSEQYPFKTISRAIDFIENGNLKNKKIFVKDGTYPESVALSRNASLIGESENGTIIDAEGKSNAINFFFH